MTILRAIYLTIIFQLLSSILYSIFLLPIKFLNFDKYEYQHIQLIISIVTLILSFFVFKKIYKCQINIGNETKLNPNLLLLLIPLIFAQFIIRIPFSDFYWDFIAKIYGVKNYFIPITYYFLLIISGSIISPIIEELFCRKFIQDQLSLKYNTTISILISSILFSVSHLEVKNLIPTFLSGLIYGYIYYKTKDIKYSIILHSFFNFFILNTNYYWRGIDIFIDENKYNIYYWLIFGLSLVIIYLYFNFSKSDKFKKMLNLEFNKIKKNP